MKNKKDNLKLKIVALITSLNTVIVHNVWV